MGFLGWRWLLGLGLALLVVVGVTAGWFLYVTDRNLPVYLEGQRAPVDGIAVNTLTLGDQTYVSGPFEFSLEVLQGPFNVLWGRRLGRTSGGLDVYRPNGHDGSQFVFVRGEMMPDVVYRNASALPLRLSDLDVTAMELVDNVGGSPTVRRTEDAALIGDLLAVLTGGGGVRPAPSPPRRIYHVRLLSDRLPGLAYFAYVIFDDEGAVYVACRAQENQLWLPVDQPLSRWLATP